MKNTIIGVLCMIIGIIILFFVFKYPTKGSLSYIDYEGYLGGLGFIALGIGFLIGQFQL